ncbi:MAG: tetratricopeptide repeat protein, partial [Myxococcota bacterium]
RAFELASPENPRAKARYARLIGVTHHLQSDLAQALSMYERSVALCGDDEPACLGTGYRHMALIYMSRGDYLSAWDLFGRAEQACRDSTDRACTETLVRLIENEAHLNQALGNHEDALAIARRAVEECQTHGMKASRPLMEIADALQSLGRWDEALEAAERAMNTARRENRRSIVAYAYTAKGDILNQLDRPAEALESFEIAHEIFTEMSKERGLFDVETGMARSYMLLGRIDEAKAYAQRSFDISARVDIRPDIVDRANRVKLEIEILEGKVKAALGSLRQRDEFMRRSFDERLSGTINRARTEFKAVRHAREVEQLKQADALKSLRLEQQRTMLLGAAALVGAMLLLATALTLALRRMRQFNRRLAEQKTALADLADQLNVRVQERECLLREINHRVNGNLQIVASLVRGQASQLRDVSKPEVGYLQLLRDLQSRIEAISLVHRELYAGDLLASVCLHDLIDRICEQLSVIFGYDGRLLVHRGDEASDIRLDVDMAVPAALIGCELVSNAMEHAFGARRGPALAEDKEIEIRLWRTSDAGESIHLEVVDNGQGIVNVATREGPGAYGLRLVEQLAGQLGGQFSLSGCGQVSGDQALGSRASSIQAPGGHIRSADASGVVARVSFPVGVREAA